MIRGNNKDQCRCGGCGRWVSYHDITKTFGGCHYCGGNSFMREMNKE